MFYSTEAALLYPSSFRELIYTLLIQNEGSGVTGMGDDVRNCRKGGAWTRRPT